MTTVLEVNDVRVEREAGLLLAVDELSVAAGEVVVVTGPTDSGKTLLASVLCGRAAPTSGTVRLAGAPLRGHPAERRRAGLAATVADGGRIAGCSVEEALHLAGRARQGEALARFPLLEARRGVRAELLSGGEQQLLQVACAWCAQPRVLVLDSPTVGLAGDVATMVADLATESAAAGAAVLWLDQANTAAPQGRRLVLSGGVLSAVPAGG